jgi:hypothetical protein
MLSGVSVTGRKAVLVVLLAITGAACAEAPQEAASGGLQVAPSPSDEASADPAALDLWDNFGVVEGHEVGRYGTLRQMIRWAQAVVVGAVERVDGERVFGKDDPESAMRGVRVTVRVIQSFKGPFKPGDRIPVGVGIAETGVNVEKKFGELIGDEAIFFVVPVGAARPEFGISSIELPPDEAGDWVLVNSQGVIVNDRGAAVQATNLVEDQLANSVDGIPFQEIEQRVQEVARG